MLILLLWFVIEFKPNIDTHHVDAIETNHVYNEKGDYVFTQIILWKIDKPTNKYHNWGWVTLESGLAPIKINKSWVVYYNNKKFIAPYHYERWLNFDIERADTRCWWNGDPPNLFKDPH
jgi:hypothetical protein